jgi:tetratricopeptide (TPR) repeat protein
MSNDHLTTLKKEVEKKLNRQILSSSDCLQLSNEITRVTGATISVNTLRRIFNLMKSKYQPSLFTLDLLSKYCGHSSYSNFTTHVNDETSPNPISDIETWYLNMLLFPFTSREIKENSPVNYIAHVHDLINNLGEHPNVIEAFHREIAKTHKGQKIYFEKYVNTDSLNDYFGQGLQYYLLENQTIEAQLFVNALQCMKSWLIMDYAALKKHYAVIEQFNLQQQGLDISLQARIFAAQLYTSNATDGDTTSICREIAYYYKKIKHSVYINQPFPSFEYILSEALILTGKYDDALIYIEEAIEKEKIHFNLLQNEPEQLESLFLFKALALAHKGDNRLSNNILSGICISKFNFLSKQFNLILYLKLKYYFDNDPIYKNELETLTMKTGFKSLVFNMLDVSQFNASKA